MAQPADQPYLRYQRSRFTARLPTDRFYTPSHFWIRAETEPHGPQTYRVGLTKFARRMLGEAVEVGFEVKPGEEIQRGEVVGYIEAMKAVSDLYCPGSGRFLGGNPDLETDPDLINRDPDGLGWLYRFQGQPDPQATDAAGYAKALDRQIDQLNGDAAPP
jgi:glycine cleavage system H protein